jgi:sulfatase modifying factor 1
MEQMRLRSPAWMASATGAFLLPILLASITTGSCSLEGLVGGPEPSGGAASSTGSSSGQDGEGGGSAGSCPPEMVTVSSVTGVFCIDRYEVNSGEYSLFLAAASDGGAPVNAALCGWNNDYKPRYPAESPSQPVVGVDWCDAHAYCAWRQKHLCGSTADGGAIEPSARNTTNDQWMVACSNGGQTIYPYGNVLDYRRCNDCDPDAGCQVEAGTLADAGAADAADAADAAGDGALLYHEPVLADGGAFPGCVTGDDGTYDLSGSVWEWENACNTGGVTEAGTPDPTLDTCSRRGGSYTVPSVKVGAACLACNAQACSSLALRRRNERSIDTGFRCCKDLE